MINIGTYDYDGLVSAWIERKINKSTASGRMTALDDVIYSYREPIAKIYNRDKKNMFMLITNRIFSNTTSKHVNKVLDYSSYIKCIRIPNILNEDISNTDDIKEEILFNIDKLKRCRSIEKFKFYKQEIQKLENDFEEYCKLFKVKRKIDQKIKKKLLTVILNSKYNTM